MGCKTKTKRVVKNKKELDMGFMPVTDKGTTTIGSSDKDELSEDQEEQNCLDKNLDRPLIENEDIKSALGLMDNDGEIIIDRDQEDEDVATFQKTGNLQLLERVYLNRVPTLRSWANKNFYPGLTTSVEDLFEDLSLVFVKAAQKFRKNRGNFNTCLFTFLLNRIKNIKNSKHAKKRISEEYEGPLCSMVLSLDFPYSDKDGSDLTLKDVIPCKEEKEDSLYFREAIAFLSRDNDLLRGFLKKISEGNSLASLLKEYRTRNGSVHLPTRKAKMIGNKKNKKMALEILKDKNIINGEFKLLGYEIRGSKMKYRVELKKTEETDFIVKAIRDLRKHKDYYMPRIRGI